jgi:hypothetical protein
MVNIEFQNDQSVEVDQYAKRKWLFYHLFLALFYRTFDISGAIKFPNRRSNIKRDN